MARIAEFNCSVLALGVHRTVKCCGSFGGFLRVSSVCSKKWFSFDISRLLYFTDVNFVIAFIAAGRLCEIVWLVLGVGTDLQANMTITCCFSLKTRCRQSTSYRTQTKSVGTVAKKFVPYIGVGVDAVT